jgi:ribosome-associated protein
VKKREQPGGGEEDSGRPSKSAAKREAQAAQELGEELIGLPAGELATLELPDDLIAALAEARRITSRSALVRQRQYIGKLMRDIDLGAIRARLAARSEALSREAEVFKRIEAWRERLLRQGPEALAELATLRAGAGTAQLTPLIEAARRERAAAGGTRAQRELFRALRALFATIP